jgi:hypothetical protein
MSARKQTTPPISSDRDEDPRDAKRILEKPRGSSLRSEKDSRKGSTLLELIENHAP